MISKITEMAACCPSPGGIEDRFFTLKVGLKMLQSIIELSNDGILVFNGHFGIEYANRTISQITGYEHARILEMTIADLLGSKTGPLKTYFSAR